MHPPEAGAFLQGNRESRGSYFPRLLGPLALAVLVFAGCGGPNNSAGRSPDTIVFGRNKDALTLDPSVSSDGISLTTTHLIYDGLTRYKPGTFDVEPALATSWEVRAGGTRWIFHLRRGVRFQDGTPFDADAVKFNFDRWRDPHNPFHAWGYFTYFVSQFGAAPGLMTDVKAIDRYTVEIDLRRPLAPMLANLAMPAFAIASPAAMRREREHFAQHPVGTGPYRLVEWVKDDHITLRRFDDYWGAKARIADVVLRDIPDAATTQLLLERGELDGWEYPPPDVLPRLGADPALRIYHQSPNNTMFMALNNLHHPFDDVRVRRAIGMAIDRDSIVRHFWDPTAQVARDFLPEAVWPTGIDTSLRYDPAAARALLAQAGYPHGFHTTLWYTTAPRPYLPEPERVAETIQADLRSVGIEATLQGFEWGVFLQRVENAEHDMCLTGWTGDNGDPDNFLYVPLDKDNAVPPGAYNLAFWRNEDFHAFVARAQRTMDHSARAALYVQALAVVRDQSPIVAIAHSRAPLILRSTLRGFVPSPDSMISFGDMWFADQESRRR
jgi:peptide/nickel transport system substrate-binding protein